jgi:hypothetical protein
VEILDKLALGQYKVYVRLFRIYINQLYCWF